MQPPAQEIQARDLHDNIWTFRHIYRGKISSIKDILFCRNILILVMSNVYFCLCSIWNMVYLQMHMRLPLMHCIVHVHNPENEFLHFTCLYLFEREPWRSGKAVAL
jgi:hypothetical protein